MAAWRLLLTTGEGQAHLRTRRDEILGTFHLPSDIKTCLMFDRVDKFYGQWAKWQCCDTCEEKHRLYLKFSKIHVAIRL